MIDYRHKLDCDGYVMIPDVVKQRSCSDLVEMLPDFDSAGSRVLLGRPAFRRLAAHLRDHADLRSILASKVAVQCTLFHKTHARNWGIRLHRDRVVPAKGDGRWPGSGIKENMCFLRPPPTFMRRLVAVRVSLDDATEGDLEVIAGSHRNTADLLRGDAVTVPVPQGGVLLMCPLLAHCSSRLGRSPARRVLHFLYAPVTLPYSYEWYHSV